MLHSRSTALSASASTSIGSVLGFAKLGQCCRAADLAGVVAAKVRDDVQVEERPVQFNVFRLRKRGEKCRGLFDVQVELICDLRRRELAGTGRSTRVLDVVGNRYAVGGQPGVRLRS